MRVRSSEALEEGRAGGREGERKQIAKGLLNQMDENQMDDAAIAEICHLSEAQARALRQAVESA